MLYSWIAVIPPLSVILVAVITQSVTMSLLVGIATASYIAGDFSLTLAAKVGLQSLWNTVSDTSILYLTLSFITMGVLVETMASKRLANQYSAFLARRIRSRLRAELYTMILSLLLFFDDYLSTLTVGNIMRSVYKKLKIPRVKLAYLVHSMSAPITIIAVASTWMAMIVGQIEQSLNGSGSAIDPFVTYLSAIPFTFYSMISTATVLFIVLMRYSFGPMKAYEEREARIRTVPVKEETVRKPENGSKITSGNALSGSRLVAILATPIISLISVFAGTSLYFGGFKLWNSKVSILQAISRLTTENLFLSMLLAGTVAAATILILIKANLGLSLKEFQSLVISGVRLMLPPLTVILLAWSFASILRNGFQLQAIMKNMLGNSSLVDLLPLLFFASSTIVSVATGSAWSALAVIIPICMQLVLGEPNYQSLLLYTSVGAVLSGAVCGNHISPIADTTIMTVAGTRCDHMGHIITQLWYALPALIGTSLAHIISGILLELDPLENWVISLGVGLISAIVLTQLLASLASTRRQQKAT